MPAFAWPGRPSSWGYRGMLEAPALPASGMGHRTLTLRLAAFVSILALEAVAVSMKFDAASLFHSLGDLQGGLVARASIWGVQFLIGLAAIYCTFLYLRFQPALLSIAAQMKTVPINPLSVFAHFGALAAFIVCSVALTRSDRGWNLVAEWAFFGVAALLFAAVAFMPLRLWHFLMRKTGKLAIYAACAAAIAASAVAQSWRLWKSLTRFTFFLVEMLLTPVFQKMVVQPEHSRHYYIYGCNRSRVFRHRRGRTSGCLPDPLALPFSEGSPVPAGTAFDPGGHCSAAFFECSQNCSSHHHRERWLAGYRNSRISLTRRMDRLQYCRFRNFRGGSPHTVGCEEILSRKISAVLTPGPQRCFHLLASFSCFAFRRDVG